MTYKIYVKDTLAVPSNRLIPPFEIEADNLEEARKQAEPQLLEGEQIEQIELWQ